MPIKEILDNSIVPITSTNIKNSAFGTGFVFWQENNESYILTCAHVIEEITGDIEKKGNICVGSIEQVEIIACGKSNHIDLAILKVNNLPKQMLNICNMYGQENIDFQISGFYREGIKNPIIGKDIKGKTKSKITLTNDLLSGWDLSIDENYKLQKGYSGSPIIDKETKKVFAVATHAEGSGSGGYAISISHLLKIWDKVPSKLRDLLNKNTAKNQDLSNTNCQLLIELSKSDKDNFYTIQAWLAYPPQEFETVYVKDESINLHDTTLITEFIENVLESLYKWNVDHNRLTLEFILPMNLFSHQIDKWTDEDGEQIGELYPIVIRSQDRVYREKLRRFWKKIKPDLDKPLSNNVCWLEEPIADILKSELNKCICFSFPFNPCNIEQDFLFKMLKHGVSIGLWGDCCKNSSNIINTINEDYFINKSLSDLPNILKEFRIVQRQNNYHLTLFWDDKDRIPPSYQLKTPS